MWEEVRPEETDTGNSDDMSDTDTLAEEATEEDLDLERVPLEDLPL